MDQTLKRHEATLRALFGAISRVGRTTSLRSLGPLLTLGEWKQLMKRLGLIDADLTERVCNLCFVASRMAVIGK